MKTSLPDNGDSNSENNMIVCSAALPNTSKHFATSIVGTMAWLPGQRQAGPVTLWDLHSLNNGTSIERISPLDESDSDIEVIPPSEFRENRRHRSASNNVAIPSHANPADTFTAGMVPAAEIDTLDETDSDIEIISPSEFRENERRRSSSNNTSSTKPASISLGGIIPVVEGNNLPDGSDSEIEIIPPSEFRENGRRRPASNNLAITSYANPVDLSTGSQGPEIDDLNAEIKFQVLHLSYLDDASMDRAEIERQIYVDIADLQDRARRLGGKPHTIPPELSASASGFSCPHCTQRRNTRALINRHINTHEKPYECPTCQKTRATQRDLDRHLDIHGRIRRYFCPVEGCSSSVHGSKGGFSRRLDNAKRHLKSHANKSRDRELRVLREDDSGRLVEV
ncbi:hypothetical protein HYFRA_00011997 [Hymenoscyphus fraxineus]|uniref:C2H2-type domain-containing protein n=1 Tax=Hymenoscyphus fraxineus TaxID=746836 RepID=A0A9N9PRH9_9HELO|nr:hypothetical protein HYFRA_00011997 [Hymenoscyphus fraxineus]